MLRCFILALLTLTGAARAESILVNSQPGGIYVVDVGTLAVRELTRGPEFFDIAVSPDGEIYGVTGGRQIWRIDPQGMHVPLSIARHFLNALSYDAGGRLVGAGDRRIVAIDIATGQTTEIATAAGFFSSGDLASGPDGALFATGSPGPRHDDTLFRLGPDGRIAQVGPIGFRNVYGLVWSAERRLLLGVTEGRELIEIDPATGAGRLIGTLAIAGRAYGAAAVGGNSAIISAR